MNQPVLHTDRLILRPLHPDDAEDLYALFSDPETMRFSPSMPHSSISEVRQYLAREVSYPGSCYWSILLQTNQTVVGQVGYIGGAAVPGIGYMLRRDLWGQGLILEACQAALEYGFSEMSLDRVEMWIEPENHASQRVAEKLGASIRAIIHSKYNHRPDHHQMQVFGITAAEWRGKPVSDSPVRMFRSQPVFLVRSIEDSVAFYHDRLGFEIEFLYREQPDSPPTHASVARGEWSGSRVVIQLSKTAEETNLVSSSYLYIFVDSRIGDLFEQYLGQGVEIISPLQAYPWGMREFAIRDPDGHRIRFGSSS